MPHLEHGVSMEAAGISQCCRQRGGLVTCGGAQQVNQMRALAFSSSVTRTSGAFS